MDFLCFATRRSFTMWCLNGFDKLSYSFVHPLGPVGLPCLTQTIVLLKVKNCSIMAERFVWT